MFPVSVLPLRLSSILLLLIDTYCILLFQSFCVLSEQPDCYFYLVLETWFLEQLFVQHTNSSAQSPVDSLQALWSCAGFGLGGVNFLYNSCYILDRAAFRTVLLSTACTGPRPFLLLTLSPQWVHWRLQEKEVRHIQESWPQMIKGIFHPMGIMLSVWGVGKE